MSISHPSAIPGEIKGPVVWLHQPSGDGQSREVVTKGHSTHPLCSSTSATCLEQRAQLYRWKKETAARPFFQLSSSSSCLMNLTGARCKAFTDDYWDIEAEIKQREVSHSVRNWNPACRLLSPGPAPSLLPLCWQSNQARPELILYIRMPLSSLQQDICLATPSVSHI